MKPRRFMGCCLIPALLWLPAAAIAGDPVGVNDALQSISGNWPDAQFSVDVAGLSEEDAFTDRSLQAEFEAAHPGYVTVLRVSSHGDMTAWTPSAERPSGSGTLPITVHPPLGREHVFFLFTDRPLTELATDAAGSGSLGADSAHAKALVRRLQALQGQGLRLMSRRIDYTVNAPAGQTQYTTRSIIRTVEEGHRTLPARIEFEFNSDKLTPQGKLDLDAFGGALTSEFRDRKVLLEGHTDAMGPEEYNLGLSERRARAARQYLMENFGLSSAQVEAAGKGTANPIAPNDSEANMSKNRRVDFIFAEETSPTRR